MCIHLPGLNFEPDGLLADRSLRQHVPPIKVTRMDWMHNFLVGGILNSEIHSFLERARHDLGLRYKDLDQFVNANWQWPSWQQTHKAKP